MEEFATGLHNPRHLPPRRTATFSSPRADATTSACCASRRRRQARVNEFSPRALNSRSASPSIRSGPEPKYVYIANTDGVVRFPYRTAIRRRTARAEKSLADYRAADTSRRRPLDARHRLLARRQEDVRLRRLALERPDDRAEADRARIFAFNPDGKRGRKSLPRASATRSASNSTRHQGALDA